MENNYIALLLSAGFRYDTEDNLWYDEHPDREKYYYRIGIRSNKQLCKLFCGGYDINLGEFSSMSDCLSNCVKKKED